MVSIGNPGVEVDTERVNFALLGDAGLLGGSIKTHGWEAGCRAG
jgi:hypothetical protein